MSKDIDERVDDVIMRYESMLSALTTRGDKIVDGIETTLRGMVEERMLEAREKVREQVNAMQRSVKIGLE